MCAVNASVCRKLQSQVKVAISRVESMAEGRKLSHFEDSVVLS